MRYHSLQMTFGKLFCKKYEFLIDIWGKNVYNIQAY